MVWLKSLVIILGVLIFLCLLLLGYGFYKKADNPEWRLFSLTQPNDVHRNQNQLIHNIKKAINISKLKLPKTCVLENFEISQNYLIVVSSGPKNCRNIFVFSLGDFSLIGNVVLEHD